MLGLRRWQYARLRGQPQGVRTPHSLEMAAPTTALASDHSHSSIGGGAGASPVAAPKAVTALHASGGEGRYISPSRVAASSEAPPPPVVSAPAPGAAAGPEGSPGGGREGGSMRGSSVLASPAGAAAAAEGSGSLLSAAEYAIYRLTLQRIVDFVESYHAARLSSAGDCFNSSSGGGGGDSSNKARGGGRGGRQQQRQSSGALWAYFEEDEDSNSSSSSSSRAAAVAGGSSRNVKEGNAGAAAAAAGSGGVCLDEEDGACSSRSCESEGSSSSSSSSIATTRNSCGDEGSSVVYCCGCNCCSDGGERGGAGGPAAVFRSSKRRRVLLPTLSEERNSSNAAPTGSTATPLPPVPQEGEDVTKEIARRGTCRYPWSIVKIVLAAKIDQVFTETTSTSRGKRIGRAGFDWEAARNWCCYQVVQFSRPPLTVQRLCELLLGPSIYRTLEKLFLALRKLLLVSSALAEPFDLPSSAVLLQAVPGLPLAEKKARDFTRAALWRSSAHRFGLHELPACPLSEGRGAAPFSRTVSSSLSAASAASPSPAAYTRSNTPILTAQGSTGSSDDGSDSSGSDSSGNASDSSAGSSRTSSSSLRAGRGEALQQTTCAQRMGGNSGSSSEARSPSLFGGNERSSCSSTCCTSCWCCKNWMADMNLDFGEASAASSFSAVVSAANSEDEQQEALPGESASLHAAGRATRAVTAAAPGGEAGVRIPDHACSAEEERSSGRSAYHNNERTHQSSSNWKDGSSGSACLDGGLYKEESWHCIEDDTNNSSSSNCSSSDNCSSSSSANCSSNDNSICCSSGDSGNTSESRNSRSRSGSSSAGSHDSSTVCTAFNHSGPSGVGTAKLVASAAAAACDALQQNLVGRVAGGEPRQQEQQPRAEGNEAPADREGEGVDTAFLLSRLVGNRIRFVPAKERFAEQGAGASPAAENAAVEGADTATADTPAAAPRGAASRGVAAAVEEVAAAVEEVASKEEQVTSFLASPEGKLDNKSVFAAAVAKVEEEEDRGCAGNTGVYSPRRRSSGNSRESSSTYGSGSRSSCGSGSPSSSSGSSSRRPDILSAEGCETCPAYRARVRVSPGDVRRPGFPSAQLSPRAIAAPSSPHPHEHQHHLWHQEYEEPWQQEGRRQRDWQLESQQQHREQLHQPHDQKQQQHQQQHKYQQQHVFFRGTAEEDFSLRAPKGPLRRQESKAAVAAAPAAPPPVVAGRCAAAQGSACTTADDADVHAGKASTAAAQTSAASEAATAAQPCEAM